MTSEEAKREYDSLATKIVSLARRRDNPIFGVGRPAIQEAQRRKLEGEIQQVSERMLELKSIFETE